MPSPFPGMNPYLEQDDAWHDFHEGFLQHLKERIAGQLDTHYIVKIDEHIYIHEPPDEDRTLLGRAGNVDMRHVAYRGTQPAVLDMIGGQIAAVSGPTGEFTQHVAAGKCRLLSTSGPKRGMRRRRWRHPRWWWRPVNWMWST